MTDQEPDRGKRKRPYRQRVICGECKKELDSNYKDNHAKTVHKGKKVAFAMVRERNQSQLAFFTKSSTESQLSHKLSRSDIQNDVHYQEDIRNESTGTTHGNHSSKPATSSSISDNSTGNGKESVPLGSEQSPLSSSNVLAHVIQTSRKLKFHLRQCHWNREMTEMCRKLFTNLNLPFLELTM